MAKQTGDIKITGTIDDLTFYKMEAKHYVRMKSSVTRKRFMNDACFDRSRKSAERFAMGNKLASEVYRMVDEERRVYKLFCYLKKRAIALLKEGKSETIVKEMLIEELRDFGLMEGKTIVARVKKPATSYSHWNENEEINGVVFDYKYCAFLLSG